jgi:hypothetical protein
MLHPLSQPLKYGIMVADSAQAAQILAPSKPSQAFNFHSAVDMSLRVERQRPFERLRRGFPSVLRICAQGAVRAFHPRNGPNLAVEATFNGG